MCRDREIYKFYTKEGMIPYVQPEHNLTRRYKREESLERICFIKDLREKGKTIPEIKALLKQEKSKCFT